MEKIRIRTCCRDAGCDGILKHIAGTPGVLTDDDAATLARLLALLIVPAEIFTDTKRAVCSQHHICLTAIAVCTKIFTHCFMPPSAPEDTGGAHPARSGAAGSHFPLTSIYQVLNYTDAPLC